MPSSLDYQTFALDLPTCAASTFSRSDGLAFLVLYLIGNPMSYRVLRLTGDFPLRLRAVICRVHGQPGYAACPAIGFPAFPTVVFSCSILPTCPIEALHPA